MAVARPVRDSDTALWLHNKLGSTEELWVSSSIGGIIKTDTIDNILRCFPVLTTTVKMKLLLGILHLPRRSLEEMKHTIDGMVELALDDMDQWVKLVANIVKTYPMMCKLSLNLDSNQIAANVIQQLQEKVVDSDTFATLPLECQYVNKNALQSLVGNQPPPRRHFALKRKPKSAALRVDLMQKSNDASSQVKRGQHGNKTVPVKHRDMTRKFSDDASPMRGIPKAPSGVHRQDSFRTQAISNSQTSTPSGFTRSTSRFSGRVERGTKLLDISEQPIGIKEAKRRKKQQQEEEVLQTPLPDEKQDQTPEYAVGLIPPTMSSQPVLAAEIPPPHKDEDSAPNDDPMDDDDDREEEEEDLDHPAYRSDGTSSQASSSYAHNTSGESLTSSPTKKKRDRKSSTSYERRTSIDEFPNYAMPATPSPFFKPAVAPSSSRIHEEPHSSHTYHPGNVLMNPPTIPTANKSSPMLSPTSIKTPTLSKSITTTQVIVKPSNNQAKPSQESTDITKNVQPPYTAPKNVQTAPANYYAPPSTNQQTAPQTQPKIFTQPGLPAYASTLYQPQNVRGVAPATPYLISPNVIQQRFHLSPQVPPVIGMPPTPGVIQVHRNVNVASTNQSQPVSRPVYQQVQQQQAQPAASQQPVPKKALTLTREQMFQAQEMFRSANRLSRQEKAIILGFMAGSRDHPCPDKGDVVQITLSEHEQNVQNPAGGGVIPVVVETLFEMNYRTGISSKKQRFKQVPASMHSRIQSH